MVSASFCFFLLFLNSDRGVVCLEFARLSGEEKEELVAAVLILHTQKSFPGHVSLFSWSLSLTVRLKFYLFIRALVSK